MTVQADEDACILVPHVRPVRDYDSTIAAALQASAPRTYADLDPINTAYLRFVCWWTWVGRSWAGAQADTDEEP